MLNQRWMTVAALLVILTSCDLVTGPATEELGIVEWITSAEAPAGQDASADGFAVTDATAQPALEVPDTVRAGEAFDVIIRTWGPDGCWSTGRTEVDRDEWMIWVTAYDQKDQGDAVCTMAPVRLERAVTATFDRPGTGVVRLTGRRIRASGEDPDTVTLEETVVVE